MKMVHLRRRSNMRSTPPVRGSIMKPTFRLLFAAGLTVMILAASTRAEDRVLKMGKPEQVGMSSKHLEIVNKILTEETKSGRVTAASVLVARKGVIVLRGGWGTLTPTAGSAKA